MSKVIARAIFTLVIASSTACVGERTQVRTPPAGQEDTATTPPGGHAEARDAADPRHIWPVDDSVPAAQDIAQKLVAPRLAVEKEMHEVVGEAARALTRRRPDGPDGLLGNLVADIMRQQSAEATGKPVDVAFTNNGGLRADLPRGPLTRGDVLEVMPFDNAMVVLELSGADLQSTLDRSSEHGGDPFSGVTFRIENRKALDIRVNGEPLDLQRTYRLCTNDYIVDGGGKYEAIKRARNVNRTGVLIRDAILSHIIRETDAGRIVDSTVGGRILSTDAPPNRGG